MKSMAVKCVEKLYRSSPETMGKNINKYTYTKYLGEERSDENEEDVIHEQEAQQNHTDLREDKTHTLIPELIKLKKNKLNIF